MERSSSKSPTPAPTTSSQTSIPTTIKTTAPTTVPTTVKTTVPTIIPTTIPTTVPTTVKTTVPTIIPTIIPTTVPTVYQGVPDPTYPMISSCPLETIGSLYGLAGEAGGQSIEKIRFNVGLSAGAASVDMSQTMITFSTAERHVTLQKNNGATPNTWRITNQFKTLTNDDVLEFGEIFELELTLSPGIQSNERFNLEIQPPHGAAYPIVRTAPSEISSGGVYELW
jgi:hypothetical protein